ncbi:MAG TPA: hypothetical protein VK169_07470 [Saprospiraceae bacterium]|nr:hypothetical protein [Saprospiraceae bacterium]
MDTLNCGQALQLLQCEEGPLGMILRTYHKITNSFIYNNAFFKLDLIGFRNL